MDIKKLRVKDTKTFILKANFIHSGKFSYENTVWENSKSKVIVTCPEHGDFSIRAANHVTKTKPQGCKECHVATTRKTNEQYLIDCAAAHGDRYDLSEVEYIGATKPVKVICKKHGPFYPQAANFANGSGCNDCGFDSSTQKNRSVPTSILEKMVELHNDKYEYIDFVENYIGMNHKMKVRCKTCDHKYDQLVVSHLNGLGCTPCSIKKGAISRYITDEEYIQRAKLVHGDDIDYSKTTLSHGLCKSTITIRCKKHDIECQLLANTHLNGCTNCPKCMLFNGISNEELEVLEFVKTCLPSDEEIISSDNQTIKPKQIDIVIPSLNIAFEYCGVYWHQEDKGKDKNYHLNKTKACEEKGIRLIHIFSNEWINNQEVVKSRIATMLKAAYIHKLNARSMTIREVSNAEKRLFLNRTHIQGTANSSVNLGLVDKDGNIQSLMTFGKSRFSKTHEYELIRFASELNTVVRGAGSKLFNHFIKNYSPNSIVSYSDLRWNSGNVYEQLGFEFSHASNPNYFYFHELAINDLMSRQRFQKHKLSKLLPIFDDQLTEIENMKLNNYGRIWDCGNSVFHWNRP